MARVFASQELIWRGNRLFIGKRKLAEIVPDLEYPSMWRIKLPDGSLSDMVNMTRARDAARAMAVSILNKDINAARKKAKDGLILSDPTHAT